MLFVAVLSHWLLDFVAHPPDMPLAPGMHKEFGLGLWTSLPATLIVEGGFWLLAILLYVRATHAKKRLGIYAFWIVIPLLTLSCYGVGRLLAGTRAGLLAALFALGTPMIVSEAHEAYLDPLQAALVAAGV